MKLKSLSILLLAVIALCSGCDRLDNKRIPPAPVYLPFATEGDWNAMRLGGAPDYKCFIKEQNTPSNYHYSALSATGFGGLLLIYDVYGDLVAFDLSCPVECKRDVRVQINRETMEAVCPQCHSAYDVFALHGHPLYGPAAKEGYGLRQYTVASPGRNNEAVVVY